MNEETKVKLRQITEMISIYQSTISDDIDMENMKLIQVDLQNKERQLNEIRESLDEELSKLYDNGANEIDSEVNQVRNQIQEIDNSLENISDLISMRPSIPQTPEKEEKTEEIRDIAEEIQVVENEPEQEIDFNENVEENITDDIEEENFEAEEIVAVSDVSEDIVEEAENIQYIDSEDEEIEDVDEIEQMPIDDELEEEIETIEQEDELEIIDEVEQASIVDDFDEEIEEESFELASQEEEETEISDMMIQLREANSDYKKESETVVDNRDKTVKTPIQAIEKGNKASELVMANIQKTLIGEKADDVKIELEKVNDYYREDERSR